MRLRLFSVLLLPVLRLGAADPVPPARVFEQVGLEAFAAVGSDFAKNTGVADLGWTAPQFEAFIDGLRAAYRGQPYPLDEQAMQLRTAIGQHLLQVAERKAPVQSLPAAVATRAPAARDPVLDYMKNAVKQLNLRTTDSGLGYRLMERESGYRPAPEDSVVVTCRAMGPDGETELPQLAVNNKTMKVSDLLPGVAEGVQMMSRSASAILVLPPGLSFGSGGWPAGVERGAPLIFTVTLHEVIAAP